MLMTINTFEIVNMIRLVTAQVIYFTLYLK